MTALTDKKNLASLFIFAFLIYVANSLNLRPSMDDQAFLHALDGKSYFDFMSHRYMTWSGRVVIDTLLIYTIKHDIFWKVMIPSSLLALSIFTVKISGLKANPINVSIAMSLILLMPESVLRDSVWWVTGAYNYILPAACAAYCYWFFVHGSGRIGIFILIPALLLAFDNEQSGLVLMMSFITSAIVIKRKITKTQISIIIFSAVKYLTLILAPGNSFRSMRETFNRMPEFADLTILNKLAIGLDRVHEMFTTGDCILLFILPICALYALRSSKLSRINVLLASVTIITYILLLFISARYNTGFLFIQKQMNFMPFNNYILLLSYIVISAYIVTMIFSFASEGAFSSSICIILAFGSVLAIGLSPTAYASGYRVLFVSYILLVLVLLKSLSKYEGSPTHSAALTTIPIVMACVIVKSGV